MERLPVEKLHGDEGSAVEVADLVGLDHVLVRHPGRDASLLQEHRAVLGTIDESGAQLLEDEQLLKITRPTRDREVDIGHSAVSDHGDAPVLGISCHRGRKLPRAASTGKPHSGLIGASKRPGVRSYGDRGSPARRRTSVARRHRPVAWPRPVAVLRVERSLGRELGDDVVAVAPLIDAAAVVGLPGVDDREAGAAGGADDV